MTSPAPSDPSPPDPDPGPASVDPAVLARARRHTYILYGVMALFVLLPLVLALLFGR